MTASSFNRPGAIDLSNLARAAKQDTPGSGGGSYVVDVTEANLQEIMGKSLQHPVILELWSPRANADTYSSDLAALAEEFGGRFLLGRINVDEQQAIAQALQVRAVPTLLALIGGQAAPLAEGAQPRAQLKAIVDQLLQLAVANGIVGRAEPVGTGTSSAQDAQDQAPDPRFAAADAALESGDYPTACAEFDKLLAANPNDHEAAAGKAQAGLLARTQDVDAAQVSQRLTDDPGDIAANLDAADLDMVGGRAEAAYERLLGIIRATNGEERDSVRVRLIELFDTLGADDPRVHQARRALTTALF